MSTHDGSILDLVTLSPSGPRSKGAARQKQLAAMVLTVAGVGIAALITVNSAEAYFASRPAKSGTVRLDLAGLKSVERLTVDDKAQIVVQGEDAVRLNTGIPLSASPLGAVTRFTLSGDLAPAHATALTCLTQAVYYEAAVEPLHGRRAVAQVVLNRMRHPAYPKSVCGVVYEGSSRVTGCQFSFTCDGSLLRAPATKLWVEAQQVAGEALAGYVEKSVGTATHYHADYVLPKWAYQLGKIAQIGRHIFYRFNGSWGQASALTGRYTGLEQIPVLNYRALRHRLEGAEGLEIQVQSANGLTVVPHVTDRHAERDVGGRLDVTKQWRLTIPDPIAASQRYQQALGKPSGADRAGASPPGGQAQTDPEHP